MSSNKQLFENLIKDIYTDNTKINDLEENELRELSKYVSPMNAAITGEPTKYAVLSIINLQEKYQKALLMTALSGYLYRRLIHWEYDGDNAATRTAVQCFLDDAFKFNADKHVRMHGTPTGDVGEVPLPQSAGPVDVISAVSRIKRMAADTLRIINDVKNIENIAQDAVLELVSVRAELQNMIKDLDVVVAPAQQQNMASVSKYIPSDTFHGFDSYLCDNYEPLRDATTSLYGIQPDLDHAVIFYDAFEKPEAAREYCRKNEDKFRSDAITIENNGVTMLGPWKQNRERIDFYNKNAELLQQMLDNHEKEQKLGTQLMEKRAINAKRKNIAEVGPDAPGLAEYTKIANRITARGLNPAMTDDEKREYAQDIAQAREIREDLEVPEDAIQTNVFVTGTDPDSGATTMTRGKMYIEADKTQLAGEIM